MKKPPTADQSGRYQELLSAAAAKHHTVPTDTRATHEASVHLLHESLVAAMVRGETIDVAAFIRVSEMLQALIPPPEPVKVEVEFVGPSITQCPKCDHQFDPDTPERTIANKKANETPRVIEGKVVPPQPDAKALPTPAVKAAAPAPAAPPPPPPPRNPSMAAWERATGRGYSRSSRDGGPVRFGTQAPVEGVNYNNAEPMCFVGSASNGQHRDPATRDVNPDFHSDGSVRKPYEPPH